MNIVILPDACNLRFPLEPIDMDGDPMPHFHWCYCNTDIKTLQATLFSLKHFKLSFSIVLFYIFVVLKIIQHQTFSFQVF